MHLLVAVLLVVAPSVQSGDSLLVEVGGRIVTLRAADLAALPRDSVRASIHEAPPRTYSGVRLAGVLRTLNVPTDSMRGPALRKRILVEAADGYRVVFSLAELSPDFGGRMVLLADRVDGAPLPASEGPWRLVVPDDREHARWIRQIVATRVLSD